MDNKLITMPNFYISLSGIKSGNLIDFNFKLRLRKYKMSIKYTSVENVDHMENKLIFICIDKPIAPSTYFNDGRNLSVIQVLHTGDKDTFVTNNKISFTDAYTLDFTNGAMACRIWVTDNGGFQIYDLNINLILAFEEVD
jgi:hypothetical protein